MRLELRFLQNGRVMPGSIVSSPPVRGRLDWSQALVIETTAPTGAAQFDVQIVLTGSFEDKMADVWIDDLEIDLRSGCGLQWVGLENQLAGPGQQIPLQLDCHGFKVGEYAIDVRLDRR